MTQNVPALIYQGPRVSGFDQPSPVGVQRFDRTAALIDGNVNVPNVNVIQVPNRTCLEGLQSGVFSAAEFQMARFVFCRSQGDPLVAVPVFIDRLFLQRYIYVRADDPISSLKELRGRRVVLPGYFITASFWHRFFLREAGVKPEEIEWLAMGAERDPRMKTPDGVKITVVPSKSNGLDLLLSGQADCIMHESTLIPLPADRGRIRRLLPNILEVESEWFRRTRILPTLHLLVVREEVLKRWPDFGIDLCHAFDLAKQEMYSWLQSERTTGVPFARDAIDWSLEVCGDDPWPYGVEKNANELNQYLDLAFADGFTTRRLTVEELFDPRALEYQFESRMDTFWESGSAPRVTG